MATSPQGFQLGLLPERKIDKRAVATGYTLLLLLLLLLINIGLLFPEHIQLRQYRVTSLIPLPALKPEPPPEPVKTEAPKPEPIRAKVVPTEPVLEAPKVIVPQEVRRIPPPEVEAPKVVVNQFAAPELKVAEAVKPRLLHTGDFAGSSVTPTVKAAVEQVQTGGFGDPNGLKGTGKEAAKLYAAQPGGFDMPVGAGQGNGSGGAKGIKGTVASADFGNGIATSNGNSHGTVATGSFGSEQLAHNGPVIARADGPATKPVEITFKPKPVYTAEARSLKLEGEVLLEVLFSANGTLHVNRVVSGLGHGLDEAAINAANNMRFKPALRMGQPVDSTAIVHVMFEMAY
ncbi:MAG TPA: energy transducer TonB [Candidatus Aquilonibacter sp.]|nr:energy transducer TonB [Candidatus Aquilonibacter sp.]